MILDQFGKPIKAKEVMERQTERSALGFLDNTFAGHPSRGLTPAKLSRISIDAEQGNLVEQAELMLDMEEKDGHIFAEMSKRRNALLNVPWLILPPRSVTGKSDRTTDMVNELFNHIPDLDDLILDMADAIGQGFANLEIKWDLVDGYYVPSRIEHRPANWFMTPVDNQNQLRLRNETGAGEILRPFGWVQHIHKSKPGYVTRSGLVRVLAWPFLFKNYSVRDLAEFLEIYGLPLRLGKYPSGSGEEEKFKLMQAVVGIGHNAAGIIPSGMEIDFKEAAKGGSGPFESMIAFCERTQSKAILGQTLTAQADGKSSTNALGTVHNDVRMDIRDSDLKQIAATITRDLLYPLAALNVPGVQGMQSSPRFVFDNNETEDLESFSKSVPALVGMGMQISKKWAHEKTGIPLPEKDEEVLQMVAAPAASDALSTRVVAASAQTSSQDALDSILQGITPQMQDEQASALLKALVDRVNAGDNYESIQDDLSDLYPDLDDTQIESALTRLFFVAETWGRLSA